MSEIKPVAVGVIGCGNISGAYMRMLQTLPIVQVAACADAHVVVSKALQGRQTLSRLQVVVGVDRVAVIARLLGGEKLSGTAHAQALLGSREGSA